jgi:ABC-type transport system involved in multi-copper enzyme maturation permease subunit
VTWVAWRQTRATALGVAGILALYGLLAVLEEVRPYTFTGITVSFTPYLFLFLALLLGAPLVSRELELGTHQFAWTQSVTRRRWLTFRLGGAVGVALLAVAAQQVTLSTVRTVGPVLPGDPHFLVHGVLPYALAAFTVTFGALAGAVIRRTVPALGITLLVTIATIGVLTAVPFGSSGWAARYWPAQLALGGALLALAVGQAAATFRLVEGRR